MTTGTFYGGAGGSMPQFYDQALGSVFFDDFAADIARRVAASQPLRVLETAAGTGIVTRRLRDLLPAEAELTATDLNATMLEIARGKFGPGDKLRFEPADATALPFADGSFDAVVCQFGTMFFPDKEKAFREAHRVLAADGRFVFSVWDAPAHNPLARVVGDTLAGLFPADPPWFFDAPFSYHHIDPVKGLLQAAGFGDLAIAVLRGDRVISDVPAFARGLVYGSPLIDEVRARGSVEPDRIVEALQEALPRAFGTGPTQMPLQAIVFEARRRGGKAA
jgi:SAM-dependent methyltransferase